MKWGNCARLSILGPLAILGALLAACQSMDGRPSLVSGLDPVPRAATATRPGPAAPASSAATPLASASAPTATALTPTAQTTAQTTNAPFAIKPVPVRAGPASPAPAPAQPTRAQRIHRLCRNFESQRAKFETEPTLIHSQALATISAQIVLDAEGGNLMQPGQELSLSGEDSPTHLAFTTRDGPYKIARSRLPALTVVHDAVLAPSASDLGSNDPVSEAMQSAVLELADAAQRHVDAGTVKLRGNTALSD